MSGILVTGATGFIGQALIPHLLDHGHESCHLLVREQYAGSRPLPAPLAGRREQLNLVYADLRNWNLTLRAIREARPEVVIHLAAAGATDPFLNPETAVRHNVVGTINLIRACFEKTSVTNRLIVARTPGERTFLNTYAASKRAAWDFCRMYAGTRGWPIIGAMIFQCYGPGQPEPALVPGALRAALAGEDFPMTAGDQQRDWIYIADVVRALADLTGMEELEPGDTVDLGSGEPSSVADVARLIYDLAGGSGQPLLGALPTRPGETASQRADLTWTDSGRRWTPLYSLREGIARTLDHIIAGHSAS